jgi:glyoxylase-like metal-dependent hydrolase (beta-lactamase superfamily II)
MQQPDRWQIGKVVVTRIVEREERSVHPQMVIAGLEPEEVREIAWLQPHYADTDGLLHFSIHAFVIESEGRRIVVDTCIGNHKSRCYPGWHRLQGPFLKRFEAAGFPVESIDTVLCTHLHIDHVGWNTRWTGSEWVPTFPNARYLFGRLEWDHWREELAAAAAARL